MSALRIAAIFFAIGTDVTVADSNSVTGTIVTRNAGVIDYSDGRASATLRMQAEDAGIVLRYGDAPSDCDTIGARDPWVIRADGLYILYYDGAGPKGWRACRAESKDLVHWRKYGPALSFGPPGSKDARAATYGTTYFDGHKWHMFYLGTPNVTPPPAQVPGFPYYTMKAESQTSKGPWLKRYDIVPFDLKKDTYYESTGSPGPILKVGREYRMLFSAATFSPILRTLAFAHTTNLDGKWTVNAVPILPQREQIENVSLYYQKQDKTWFLFTDHVGISPGGMEYTDAIWVYWSKDLNNWNPANKAVVLDGNSSSWSHYIVGLPTVTRRGGRLAILYDGHPGAELPGESQMLQIKAGMLVAPGEPNRSQEASHIHRNLGLAWLNLPLVVPGNALPLVGSTWPPSDHGAM